MSTQLLSTSDQIDITRRALAIVQETGTDLETAVAQASKAHEHTAEVPIDYYAAHYEINTQITRMCALIKLLRVEIDSFYSETPCAWEPQKLMLYNPWAANYVESANFSDFVDMYTDATDNVLHVLTRVKRVMDRDMKRRLAEAD